MSLLHIQQTPLTCWAKSVLPTFNQLHYRYMLKSGPTPASFYDHPVSGAGIRTNDILDVSLLP